MKIAMTILSLILFSATAAITAGVNQTTISFSNTPDYYMYQGEPVQMQLDPGRLLVRYASDATELERSGLLAKSTLGLAAEVEAETAHWQILSTGTPLEDPARASNTIEALTALPQIAFVSPVFNAPYGGWVTMTPEILIRLKPEYIDQADALIAELAPGMEIVKRDFAGLPGTFYLRTNYRNGYDVLKTANAMSTDPRVKWAEPDMMSQVILGNDEIEPHDMNALMAGNDNPNPPTSGGTPQQSALTPNDPYFSNQWWLKNTGQFGGTPGVDIGAESAWDISMGSSGVKVLVMDAGIQQDHPDINQEQGRDFTIDSLTSPYGDPVDDCDKHGTPCGGIISAITNNGIGVAGVAPGCKVLSARIFMSYAPCSNTNIVVFTSGIAAALEWGEAQGARVSTASFTIGSNGVVTDAYASTYANGMVHFSSAGNNATTEQSYPAALVYVNAVSAVAPSGDLASFSNYGGWISVSAPGVTILTTDRTAPYGYYSGGDYTYFGGTSAASPCAAGVAAMILSVEPTLTADEVTDKIRCTGLDLGVPGPDPLFGFGMTNSYQAISVPLGSDDDSDGFNDACDNCPDLANSDQDDADWDGQGDACDPCPEDPNNDADADGICGNIDNCPGTPNPDQNDTDEDGVGDLCDNCVDIPNPDQADADQDNIGDLCESCCIDIRGNANGDLDENINISDITYLVDYLFGIPLGPEPPCLEEGNANDDENGDINISDITYLVDYLFGVPLGPAPASCP